MSRMRRVLAVDGRGQFLVVEEPVPDLRPGQIRVRVRASLVSPGTELGGVHRLRERPDASAPPRPFGYANAGDVIAVGEGVHRFRAGDRVACMGAGYALHATEAVVPQNLAVPLPDTLSYADGSFAHLAATALHAVRRAAPEIGEHFLVIGLGIVGQLCAQFSRLAGAHVMAWDRLPLRLAVARQTGCDCVVNVAEEDPIAAAARFTRGHGMDASILAFGGDGTDAFRQAVRVHKVAPDTHQMGRIVIVGGCSIQHQFAAALGNLDVRSAARTGPGYHDEAWEHGADYPPVYFSWTTQRNLEECLRFMEEGRIQVRPIVTHQVPLDEAPGACDLLVTAPGEALGVVIEP